jgi:hypothetical protein
MQQIAKPTPDRGNSQTQTVLITALFLFALAGGIMGFAVGAFAHSRQDQQQTNTTPKIQATQPIIAKTQPSPTATITQTTEPLGGPIFAQLKKPTTTTEGIYTLQAVLESTGQPLNVDGITCRLDLIKKEDGQTAPQFKADQLKAPNDIGAPLQEEVAGFQFDGATPQVQPCKNGKGYWQVTVLPSLPKGTYFVVGITNWNGDHYNWSWGSITRK